MRIGKLSRYFSPALISLGLLLQLATAVTAHADVRDWTSKFGSRTVSGEFIEVREGKLALRKADGSKFNLPISALITEDQELAVQLQNGVDTENKVDVAAALKNRMIRVTDGKPESFAWAEKAKPTHFLFYVVSSLCDTCLDHAPRLKEYYEESLVDAPEIELVVISLDTDKEQQQDYLAAQSLPFPAVDFEAMDKFSTAITPRIFDKAVDGCQTFILTTADGKVLGKSALEPKQAIAKILQQAQR